MRKILFFRILFSVFLLLSFSGCEQGKAEYPQQPILHHASPAATQEPCEKIALSLFIQQKTQPEIFTICPDGTSLTQLTDDPGADTFPAWSPDGRQIAFTSDRGGQNQIYLMLPDGTELHQLTDGPASDHPIWLPDGRQIAFRSTDSVGLWWWQTINLDTNQITAFSEPSFDFFYQTPAWSPDGNSIATMSLEEQKERNDGASQIHIRVVDDPSVDLALTKDAWANIYPAWSPDGKKMAFLSERGGNYNVYALCVMDLALKTVKEITPAIYTDYAAFSWSSDSSQIAIGDISTGQIHIVDVNSGENYPLDIPGNFEGIIAFHPAWQP